MAEQLHVVDLETCLGDGICADVSPENILEIVVIESREELNFLLEQLVKDYEFTIKGFSNPFIRRSIRRDLAGVRYQ